MARRSTRAIFKLGILSHLDQVRRKRESKIRKINILMLSQKKRNTNQASIALPTEFFCLPEKSVNQRE
jgi:hypothetical protein